MSKTLTLSALRTAQGLRPISNYNSGYTATDFSTGASEYANLSYPVTMQFEPLPEIMQPFSPTGRSVTVQLKLTEPLSYQPIVQEGYTRPTNAQATSNLINAFRKKNACEAWTPSEKNDLVNGIFSCVNASKAHSTFCPEPTVSGLSIYTEYFPGLGTLYYATGTCTLPVGVYNAEFTLTGNPENNGLALYSSASWSVTTNSGTLSVTYNQLSLAAITDAPVGYIDRTTPNVFSWHTTWTGFPVETVAQTSATLQWKNGESGSINSIPISGASTSYTMAANTLPESSELYWRVQTTTASGTATSDWRAVRTVDTEGFCAGISPSGAYIDGTEQSHFVWTYSTASGAAPSGYDLQIKGTADADFRTIASATTTDTFALIPAGTLPGGSLQWRVRGYNQSSVAGEWSEPLSCVVISAPAAPEVWIEQASPRPTVAWSAVGQLAFEVRAGSYSSGTIFGTDKSFKIPAYLPDGQTAVQVRVLGEYDLWSPYGQTSLTVANAGSGEILLTAQAQSGDAALSWTVAENATGYQILRGGKLIAETAETAYLDPYSIGSVTYRVRAVLPGDDYILSNPASVTLSVPCPRIRALDGGWIELDTYTTPLPSLQITATRDVALMQYAGHDYPIPEVSRHRTRTWIANPAFSDHAKAAAFEQLLGRVVYVKDQYGTEMTGIMASLQRMPSRFYTELTAVVQEIGGFDV